MDIKTHEDVMKRSVGLFGRSSPGALLGRKSDLGAVPVIDALGANKARATAKESTASSTFSACLILFSATAASASLPQRSNSTTSRRLELDCTTSCSFSL
jgi:hypothetical protein